MTRHAPIWNVDAVIHALGSKREEAQHKLTSANFVISTRHYLSDWQAWSVSQNFWFYNILLSDYEPIFYTPTTIVWAKLTSPRLLGKEIKCEILPSKEQVKLDTQQAGFYKVILDYEMKSLGYTNRYLTLLRNNMAFVWDIKGYMSLPPGKHKLNLIVSLMGQVLDSKKLGAEHQFKINSCAAYKLNFNNPEVINNTFYLTDINWESGYGKKFAGFFVPNTTEMQEKFAVGRFVEINNEVREIISLQPNDVYLNVSLEGNPFSGKSLGEPDKLNSYQLKDYVITDEYWSKGIGKFWSGFFVPNSPKYREKFTVGKYVKLKNGELRKIINTQENKQYLNIYLEGAIFSPEEAGTFEQIKLNGDL